MALGCLIGLVSLGCRSEPTPRDLAEARARAVDSTAITVLPSETQLALGALTGVDALATHAGRRDELLGTLYQPPAEIRLRSVDVRDDQRVINGRVQSNLLWRTRTYDLGR